MNKFIEQMETDINEENVVTKLLSGAGESDVDLTNGEYTKIPIELIKYRPENNYSMQSIEKLAANMWNVGQLMPVIVYADNDGEFRYTLSDGERRLRAIKLCLERAKEENDTDKIKQFSKVDARILSRSQMKEEEKIHHSANTSRVFTIFEIIARYEPSENNYFATQEARDAYLKRSGKENAKYNNIDIGNDIYLRFSEDYPQYEAKKDTIVRNVNMVMKLDKSVINAVLKMKITPRKARAFETLDRETQRTIIDLINDGRDPDEAIAEVIGVKVEKEEVEEAKETITLESTGRQMSKLKEKYMEILNTPKKTLNGNQKEYLKQIGKIFKDIEKLEQMPRK